MKKYIFLLITIFIGIQTVFSDELNDSTGVVNLNEVSIVAYKETNYKNSPISSTLLDKNKIELFQIGSIKEMNGIVPNFYVPDYGSSLSSAVYIRGLGSRNSGQSISLYVDNLPYVDKSAFDFELYDLSQIEVLRGPQGTLYGRNSLGGIVNVFTISPMAYQGTRVSIKAGNYGQYYAKVAHYMKPTQNFGLSISGYYNHLDGFYTNAFDNSKADREDGFGGRVKAISIANENTKLEYIGSVYRVKQKAFPYGLHDRKTGTTALPNFNDPGTYQRTTFSNVFSTTYTNDELMLNTYISHQFFDDKMQMDQDYLPLSIFQVKQMQKQNMLNGEMVLKSNKVSDYQWSIGVNLLAQKLNVNAPVSFKEDAIKMMLNPQFAKMNMQTTNTVFEIPGDYNNRTNSVAFFHQSTINNLFVNGLSLTGGVRVGGEEITLDYNTSAALDLLIKTPVGNIPMQLSDSLIGTARTSHIQVNPRIALKYEWDTSDYVYFSITRGHKSGGFNIQMVSDLVNQKLMNSRNPKAPVIDVEQSAAYKPEISWNYEIGFNNVGLENRLNYSITTYYTHVKGLQLTKFVKSGSGRMLTNAGIATSKGCEVAISYQLFDELGISATYGLADAKFENYTDVKTVNGVATEIDYKGKNIPYAPKNTVGVQLNYNQPLEGAFIGKIYASANYNGIGKIHWNEANDLTEDYYSLVSGVVGVQKGAFTLELWGKNLLNTKYNAFYFKSFGHDFFQTGKPLQCGATLKMEL